MLDVVNFEGIITKKADITAIINEPEVVDNCPVLIYLHPAGFFADKNMIPTSMLGLRAVKKIRSYGFLLVQPVNTKNDIWRPDDIALLIENLARQYPINKQKIAICGVSMGARGTLDCICSYPELFSCAVSIGGFACYLRAQQIAKYAIPVTFFHGRNDTVVPIEEAAKMYFALEDKGSPVRFFPSDGGHETGTDSLESDELLSWILAQNRLDNIVLADKIRNRPVVEKTEETKQEKA